MLTSLIESRGEAQRCLLCCRAVSYHGFAEMSTVFPGFLRKMLKTARLVSSCLKDRQRRGGDGEDHQRRAEGAAGDDEKPQCA